MNKKIYIYIVVGIVIIVGAGMYVDKSAKINIGQPSLTATQNPANPAASNLGDYGKAPDFKAGDTWLNSAPLTISQLKGKVVLIDFWTYSCINCIRTLPYVTGWYNTYKDKGLVVVGVHSPEFSFEQDTNNVKNAIAQFGIKYPVVQDNDYSIWNSYNNQYWPAEYLINQQGEIVEENFGEGDYDTTQKNIATLLGVAPAAPTPAANNNLNNIGSPEMYFGTARLANLTSTQSASLLPKEYIVNPNPGLNAFSLGGQWQFSSSNVQLIGSSGQIALKFHSGSIYMVASSETPATLSITVDGKAQPSVTVQASKLYTLFSSQDYSDHTIEITVSGAGFQGFTFTFG